MTETDVRAKVATVINMLKAAPPPPKQTPDEIHMAEAMIIGVELLGELFIDIKRIADALEGLA